MTIENVLQEQKQKTAVKWNATMLVPRTGKKVSTVELDNKELFVCPKIVPNAKSSLSL